MKTDNCLKPVVLIIGLDQLCWLTLTYILFLLEKGAQAPYFTVDRQCSRDVTGMVYDVWRFASGKFLTLPFDFTLPISQKKTLDPLS
jgi:hypothetical protein